MSAEMPFHASVGSLSRRRALAGLLATAGTLLGGCSGNSSFSQFLPPMSSNPPPQAGPAAPGTTIGTGEVKAGLILPLSAGGNAGVAGQAMRNAAEMALNEFNAPNIQLLVKDDGGNADTARLVAQQALDEGAEMILGPLFAQSVSIVGQVARARNMPVIAFSTDANVASNGVYLLSFLPETDVDRIVQYASSTGKRLYAALIPDNPYGIVVEAAFKQAVARRNGQIVALEHYTHERRPWPARCATIATAWIGHAGGYLRCSGVALREDRFARRRPDRIQSAAGGASRRPGINSRRAAGGRSDRRRRSALDVLSGSAD